MEEWRPLPGYEQFYAISNQGRVYRLRRARQKGGFYYLKPYKTKRGYVSQTIFDADSKRRIPRVHQLVALTFIGPPPSGKPEINHINGDKSDNRVENLEWVSRSENSLHSTRVLGKRRGEDTALAKLTSEQVREIRARYIKKYGMQLALANEYGVHVTTIRRVLKRKTWMHVD